MHDTLRRVREWVKTRVRQRTGESEKLIAQSGADLQIDGHESLSTGPARAAGRAAQSGEGPREGNQHASQAADSYAAR